MPSTEENVQFLFSVLTTGGPPTINWDAVGKDLNLEKGAVNKRWSRLKQAMTENKDPGPSAHAFLWLCVKHQERQGKTPDWKLIAPALGIKPGAASKRFSRLQIAMRSGAEAPTAGDDGNSKAVTKAAKGKAAGQESVHKATTATGTSKRKRNGVKQEEKESGEDDGEHETEPTASPSKARKTGGISRTAALKTSKVKKAAMKEVALVKAEPSNSNHSGEEEFHDTTDVYDNLNTTREGQTGRLEAPGYDLDNAEILETNMKVQDWLHDTFEEI